MHPQPFVHLPFLAAMAACGSQSHSGDPSDSDDPPSLAAESIDLLQYQHGSSSGPCTDSILSVSVTGDVTLETNLPNYLGGSTGEECSDQTSDSHAVDAAEAAQLIETVCESFNDSYYEPEDCDGAWVYVSFYEGDVLIEKTGNIACEGGMEDGIEVLGAFESGL